MAGISYKNILVMMFFIFAVVAWGITPTKQNNVISEGVKKVDAVSWCKASEDCRKLAEALVWEARGEPLLGKFAVANVIMNRVMHPKRWGASITEVINEKNQFSYLQDMHKQRKPTNEDWELAKKIAYETMNKRRVNPIDDALFYHSTAITPPKWTKKMVIHRVIGNHIFYTCKEKC